MMNKGDYEAVGSALRLGLPYRGQRIRVYRRMVRSLSVRNPQFDPVKFGESMGLPRLFCTEYLAHHNKEEVK